jgi:hypothetical protein
MVIIAGPSGGNFITTTSIDRWGCGVTVLPFHPGGPDERLDAPAIDRAVAEWYGATNTEREAEERRADDLVGYPKGWPAASTTTTDIGMPMPAAAATPAATAAWADSSVMVLVL